MILSKAIEGYLLEISATFSRETVALYQKNLRLLLQFIGDKELTEVNLQDLTRFIVYLRNEYKPKRMVVSDEPLSPSAVDNHWKCIRSLFGWANRVLDIPRPDSHLVRPRFKLPEVTSFSQDEIKRILYSCEWSNEVSIPGKRSYRMRRPTSQRDKALVLFLLDTGLRIGEVSRLKLADVDLQSGEVIVSPFGTGRKTKPRRVYIGQSTKRALWVYMAKQAMDNDDPLFFGNSRSIRTIIRSLGERAGVSNCHPHRFRHTFAIEYLRNGGDTFTLQRLLGHSSLEMVRHYLNIVEADNKAGHLKASPADHWKL